MNGIKYTVTKHEKGKQNIEKEIEESGGEKKQWNWGESHSQNYRINEGKWESIRIQFHSEDLASIQQSWIFGRKENDAE